MSYASLSRAAAGRKLPTWPVTRGFVIACGADPDEWQPRWEAARDASSHPHCARIGVPSPPPLPDPATAQTYDGLLAALRAVRAAADTSPAGIERRTGGRLGAGRAAAILDGTAAARGEEWVLLLRACGLRDEVRDGADAWNPCSPSCSPCSSDSRRPSAICDHEPGTGEWAERRITGDREMG